MKPEPVCVTCGDVALAGTVIELLAHGLALIEIEGSVAEVGVTVVDVMPGDRVLVHAGEAIGKIP